MRVKRAKLIPGCVLLNDVTGKTSRPIIPKNTVLTDEHILILQKFLIDTVHVSPRLVQGKRFIPKGIDEKEVQEQSLYNKQPTHPSDYSFKDHYMMVVKDYKKMFAHWQSNFAVDMPAVRELLLPLYKRLDDMGSEVFSLYRYATRDDYIFHHSVSVGLLSAYIARKMGHAKGEWLQIGLAGFLSDCGMAKLDQSIVKEDRSLTPEEWVEVQRHSTYSYRLIEEASTVTQAVKTAVLQHHERMDGSGYPLGLSNKKIHPYARIIAVCDMYHSMTSERLYKRKKSPFKVLELLQTKQFSKLDPEVVHTFVHSLADVTIGSRVRLSNNQTGEIIFINEAKNVTRPMVKMDGSGEIISLEKELSLSVSEILGN